MENPADEEKEIAWWENAFTPMVEALAEHLDSDLHQYDEEHENVTFAIFDTELPELSEERIRRNDIPAFLERGDQACVYRMRFSPIFLFIDSMTVGICLSHLPEPEVRRDLKEFLEESIPAALAEISAD